MGEVFLNSYGLPIGDDLANQMFEIRFSVANGAKIDLIFKVLDGVRNFRRVQQEMWQMEKDINAMDAASKENQVEYMSLCEKLKQCESWMEREMFFYARWDFLPRVWDDMQLKHKDKAPGMIKKYVDTMIRNKINSSTEKYKQSRLNFYEGD